MFRIDRWSVQVKLIKDFLLNLVYLLRVQFRQV